MNRKVLKKFLAGFVMMAVSSGTLVSAALIFPSDGNMGDLKIPHVDKNSSRKVVEESQKANLSESKKKLSTDLLRLIDDNFLLPAQDRVQVVSQMKELKQFIAKENNDLVYVYIKLNSSVQTSVIDSLVWEVTDRDEKNHLAVALVEVDKLEALTSLNDVKKISAVLQPIVHSGSVVTEGDIIHQTDDVRATYSQSGAGIKIGVISDGVDNIDTAKSSFDLPADVTVLSNSIGGDEGTAMLEIIHDMVPDADLYFHDLGGNVIAFNSAIDSLVAAGVDVIVDDIGWIGEPFFEDGIVASHVTNVLADNDIIYVSSAGNSAKKHYQGDYYNDGSDFHDFNEGSGEYSNLCLWLPPDGEMTVVLQWNDEFGSSNNDYDLYLYDSANQDSPLAGSIEIQDGQNGDDDPLEWVSYTNTTDQVISIKIDVYNYFGLAATKTLEVFIYTKNSISIILPNNITPVDSIFGHPAVPGVIAVGAIAADDPGNDDIEYFSSQGPVTIIGESPRAKPDVAGIDGVTVTGAGGFSNPFYGTSAAAPHIAAIATQLWGQYPSATSDQIRDHLLNTAVDLGDPGFDTIFGYGRADALLAFETLGFLNHTISGTLKYYDNIKTIPNATVILEDGLGGQLATTTTDINGYYEFTGLTDGNDYVVRMKKDEISYAGLSSADQIKIGRHIVQLETFDSIYKIIAGDVNNSYSLSSADQIKIGRFIVQLDLELPSGTWKFYSSEAVLTEGNYLTEGLQRTYTNLTAEMTDQNFTGVKMGDVNNSWNNN